MSEVFKAKWFKLFKKIFIIEQERGRKRTLRNTSTDVTSLSKSLSILDCLFSTLNVGC